MMRLHACWIVAGLAFLSVGNSGTALVANPPVFSRELAVSNNGVELFIQPEVLMLFETATDIPPDTPFSIQYEFLDCVTRTADGAARFADAVTDLPTLSDPDAQANAEISLEAGGQPGENFARFRVRVRERTLSAANQIRFGVASGFRIEYDFDELPDPPNQALCFEATLFDDQGVAFDTQGDRFTPFAYFQPGLIGFIDSGAGKVIDPENGGFVGGETSDTATLSLGTRNRVLDPLGAEPDLADYGEISLTVDGEAQGVAQITVTMLDDPDNPLVLTPQPDGSFRGVIAGEGTSLAAEIDTDLPAAPPVLLERDLRATATLVDFLPPVHRGIEDILAEWRAEPQARPDVSGDVFSLGLGLGHRRDPFRFFCTPPGEEFDQQLFSADGSVQPVPNPLGSNQIEGSVFSVETGIESTSITITITGGGEILFPAGMVSSDDQQPLTDGCLYFGFPNRLPQALEIEKAQLFLNTRAGQPSRNIRVFEADLADTFREPWFGHILGLVPNATLAEVTGLTLVLEAREAVVHVFSSDFESGNVSAWREPTF